MQHRIQKSHFKFSESLIWSSYKLYLSPQVRESHAVLKPQKVARAFPELRCVFGDRAIVPDVTVFTWERIPRKENGGVANVFAIAPIIAFLQRSIGHRP
jgi:Uma2 family endonuclease